ncbi:MAG: signal recognition particle-docking protein FtsY [Calditrichia bacterium]
MADLFKKLKRGIAKTREQVFGKLAGVVGAGRKIDDDLLEEIEEVLISSDVGVNTSMNLMERVKERVKKERCEDSEQLLELLAEEVAGMFPPKRFSEDLLPEKPYIMMMIGVNGTGKTTSTAKLASRYKAQGKRVLLAAADTFRAAAVEQLQEWADRIDVELIKQQSGSDPGAVAFDAMQAARSREVDIVMVDTAGRLHTKVNLMEELKKIKRVIQKVFPEGPHLNLLVLDATTGQNAIKQAEQFKQAVGLDGIILTKLDGTAKGGSIIGIAHQLGVPVYYIGVGEQVDDLQPFDPSLYARSLFSGSKETAV